MRRLFILYVIMACSVLSVRAEEIQVKGSDTIIKLTQRLAEVYNAAHPDVSIAVSGGGSAHGIAAIIDGRTHIADASRKMMPKEIERAEQRQVQPVRVMIAIDAVAVVVNKENPVKKLTIAQLGDIFRGDITNWAVLGGPDLPITLYGRQSTSGTFSYFRARVVKADYSPLMSALHGNAAIVETVKADRSGIGYVGVGYIREASGINVVTLAEAPHDPYFSPLDEDHVLTGSYPLTRPLNQYLNGKPDGVLKDFIAFELSPEGQELVRSEGFFPLTAGLKLENAEAGF